MYEDFIEQESKYWFRGRVEVITDFIQVCGGKVIRMNEVLWFVNIRNAIGTKKKSGIAYSNK